MPTTWYEGWAGSPGADGKRRSWPIGSRPGQSWRASASLTSATRGASRSVSSARGERAAAGDREAERREVVTRHDGEVRPGRRALRARRLDVAPLGDVAEGHERRQARRLHARRRTHAVEHRRVGGPPPRLVVAGRRRIDRHHEPALQCEAGVRQRRRDRAAQEQPAGGQEHQRQRELPRHHQLARQDERAPAAPARRRSRLVLEIAEQVGRGQAPRRPERGDERAQHGEAQGHGEHPAVGRRVEGDRQRHHRDEREHERARGPEREHQAGGAANRREERALGEELAHEAGAAAANRQADRDLAPPCRAAREQHVGQVQARHEQHDRRHRHQQRGHGTDLAVLVGRGAQREPRHPVRGERVVAILARIALRELAAEGVEPFLRGDRR